MYKNILVATDGSEAAGRAADQAIALAKLLGSKLTFVTVTEPTAVLGAGYAGIAGTIVDPLPELIKALDEAAAALLADVRKKADVAGVAANTTVVSESFPAEGITSKAAEIGADLIVMGSHGRRGLGRLLLGSQTSNVLAHSKIPVLVTR
jgi:nucleotide-binding universal stress UspA family protein